VCEELAASLAPWLGLADAKGAVYGLTAESTGELLAVHGKGISERFLIREANPRDPAGASTGVLWRGHLRDVSTWAEEDLKIVRRHAVAESLDEDSEVGVSVLGLPIGENLSGLATPYGGHELRGLRVELADKLFLDNGAGYNLFLDWLGGGDALPFCGS